MAPHASVATMSLGSGPEQRPVSPRLALPVGGWLAHHDVGPAWQPRPPTARDAARGRVLALSAGLLATGALLFTARRFALSRDGRVTGRYATAREQLGCEKVDVRIGCIHALERVARDSPADHPAVMEMLAAFIRERSREQWPPPDPGGQARQRSLSPDVRAAITAVGRRLAERDIGPVDLARADLTGADLGGVDLTGADLTEAVLAHAVLPRADLPAAKLIHADLAGADLGGARLTGADLTRANLTGADLTDVDLTGADLTGADLTRAELTGALWPAGGLVPAGWDRHTGSGQLIPAGTRAETAQADQPHG
jgi:pentapeptide repeat protein